MSQKPFDRELILREGQVVRPFEARLISEELRERVAYFKFILEQQKLNKFKVWKKKSYRKI